MPFDLKTHHYNAEGKVVRETPYRLTISQEHGKLFERPPYSGVWYAEDGTLVKDESAAVNAQKAAVEAKKQAVADQEAREAREKLKAELRAEILAEQQKAGGARGTSNKN